MSQFNMKKSTGLATQKLVLKNRNGQLARVYDWAGDDVTIIFRHDTRRVEPVLSTEALLRDGVEFEILHKSTAAGLEKSAFVMPGIGSWSIASADALTLVPEVNMKDEDDREEIILVGKWVSGVQVGFIALMLLLGYFLKPEIKPEEVTTIRTVQIDKVAENKPVFTKPTSEKPREVRQARPVVQKQVVKRPEPKIVTRRAPKQPTHRLATAQAPKSAPNLNNLGALGALGGMGKKMQSGGGLNLNGSSIARGGERGQGGGGVGGFGSGGVTNALFGKGLIAASPGSGARAGSAGGYGTRGKGGGRMGYGDSKILGSSGGTVAPLDSESFIEGGLTREQVEEVILRNMGQITYCYEKGLQSEPSLRGRVSVAFVIGSNGKVNLARLQHTSVESKQLESCIVGRVKQFQFPRPVAGVNVQVQYPFSFRRVSSN
ncbi:MAG: AgmX/PglI C-terminal domain-containing protein [Bdellovibrionales bacterium]|nr:AgmX/PglI C-terminal domain-containing protein [Bdellovibrionales bacterium]